MGHQDLELNSILIADIPPMKEKVFNDPYKYVEEPKEIEGEAPPTGTESALDKKKVEFKYLLGKELLLDS